ncbi:MAG: hypothetical protein KF749_13280 [Bacteroidetes bacterium]|nr:hypothetical protein [Bacteroidota bacterium]MCW5894334.1 hypothetical protein [Bacteroidota bacterium]
MGRHGWRPVVEDGLKLDIYRLQKQKILRQGYWSLQWTNTVTGEKRASISYYVDLASYFITLCYTSTTFEGEKVNVNDKVRLEATSTNFGGERFWFMCPRCSRRCAKLYLPSGAIHFRCRVCYNLTYESSNESHKFDGLFRHIASDLGTTMDAVKKALRQKGYK